MKRKDLKEYMIIELRNGFLFILYKRNDGELFGVNNRKYIFISDFNDDLSNRATCELDIIRVRKAWFDTYLIEKDWKLNPVIWESNDFVLTDNEKIQLSLFKKYDYWIAKDFNGEVYVYNTKPTKNIQSLRWVCNLFRKSAIQLRGRFAFLSWEDEEPVNIDRLLEINNI